MKDATGQGNETADTSRLTTAGGLTRRQIIVRGGAAGAALSLSGLLAACGSGSTGTGTNGAAGGLSNAPVKHVTWGMVGQAPAGLDIATVWSVPQEVTASLGMEGLVEFDSQLKLTPVLAQRWSQPDPTHYKFDLRSGVKFWDGTPLTVDDVVFSLNRHFDPRHPSMINYYFANVASAHAEGPNTVIIEMKQADVILPQALTLVRILPKKFAEEMGDKLGSPGVGQTMMGTGPYEITSYTTENGGELTQNQHYWGKSPAVAAASIKYFESPQTMQLASRSGSITGGFGFPLSEAASWDRLPNVGTEYATDDGLISAYLTVNVTAEPWNDVHVRRAVAYACDRQGFVNAFLSGKGVPATSFIPQGMWANLGSSEEIKKIYDALPSYTFDLDRAKAELAKSSHPDGFSATVPYLNTQPQIGHALVSLSQTLKQIGINLTVKPEPESEWIANVFSHKSALNSALATPDYVDPTDYMSPLLLSENAHPEGTNFAEFKNATVDRLLQQASREQDTHTRATMLGEAMNIALTELPYIPLWIEGPSLAVTEPYAFDGFNPLYYGQPWLTDVGQRA